VEVVNCKNCGRLYNAVIKRRLCPECSKALEEKFMEVKRYIDDYPGATMDEVSKECDVTVKQIKDWVKEERLTLSEASMDGITCEQCGKMIRSGKFCPSCRTKIANELQRALDGKPVVERKRERDKDRMRFLQQNF